jgi:hypothetical protein
MKAVETQKKSPKIMVLIRSISYKKHWLSQSICNIGLQVG